MSKNSDAKIVAGNPFFASAIASLSYIPMGIPKSAVVDPLDENVLDPKREKQFFDMVLKGRVGIE